MKCPYCIKVCTKCGKILVAYSDNFNKAKNGKYGLRADCKKCHEKYKKQWKKNNKEYISEYNKQYRENNKEYISEYKKQHYEDNKEYYKKYNKQYHKQWKEDNKEYIKEYKKQYYEDNKGQILEKNKQYYEDNKEQILEKNKQYREDNKKYYKEYNKQWRKDNPDKVFNYHNDRRLKKENQGRGISKDQWLEMMKFFDWKCAYSGEYVNNSKIRTIDHIIPLAKGGLNEIWNCVPMIKSYNRSKHIKDMLEWYKQQDFFNEERLNKIYQWCEYAYNKWGNEL